MSNQERIDLEGMIKAYAGCSRIIATIQRASSTELPTESGEKRWAGCPVKVRPFCASKQQKNARAREAEWELGTFATDKYRSSLTTSRNHYAA